MEVVGLRRRSPHRHRRGYVLRHADSREKIARLSELQGREMSVFQPLQSLPRHVDRVLSRESPKWLLIFTHIKVI